MTSNHGIIGVLSNVIKNPPSFYTYSDFLVKKDSVNTGWKDAVEKATSYGLNDKELISFIELFSKKDRQTKKT